ncbi:uncharacterized protein LOC116167848 [Photinus pyralis]|nr:uncharacterized protein LOC116167847 [Photinus pyralis]XP_031339263.1 uncharacterized protein LOC116167848 [Photinus pyralis]
MSVFVNMSIKLAVLLFAIIFQKSCQSYLIPKPEITVYSPKGFSVSIPHTHGISSVTFQGNINRELRNFNDIDLLSNVTKVENGKWIIRDFNSRLQSGDLISYRLLVVKKCLRYWFQGERFLVKEVVNLLPSAPPIPVEKDHEACMRSIHDLTQTTIQQKALIEKLESKIQHLSNYVNSQNGRSLILTGRITKEGYPSDTVTFVLNELLNLDTKVLSAHRNTDGSITFEVPTSEDKSDILEALKKSRSTRISIKEV